MSSVLIRQKTWKFGKFFTADDGQVDLSQYSYLVIGTLVSYKEMCKYFGKEKYDSVICRGRGWIAIKQGSLKESDSRQHLNMQKCAEDF